AWRFAANWEAGANLLIETGRPRNAFGVSPDLFAGLYGNESFYQGGQVVQRGDRGRTPATARIDLSLQYMTEVAAGDLPLGVDLFNVFNSTNATEVVETAEQNSGAADIRYGLPSSFEQPRYIRLSADLSF